VGGHLVILRETYQVDSKEKCAMTGRRAARWHRAHAGGCVGVVDQQPGLDRGPGLTALTPTDRGEPAP